MLQQFDIVPQNFLNYCSLAIGPPNTGKTVIIKHICNEVAPYISHAYVYCETNEIRNDYTGVVPSNAIYKTFNYEMVKKLKDRQAMAS